MCFNRESIFLLTYFETGILLIICVTFFFSDAFNSYNSWNDCTEKNAEYEISFIEVYFSEICTTGI